MSTVIAAAGDDSGDDPYRNLTAAGRRALKKKRAREEKKRVRAARKVRLMPDPAIKAPAKIKMPPRVEVPLIKVTYMTPEEWAKVPPNPFQRSKRAGRKNVSHLYKFTEEHATVQAGVYPDGRTCKINGHSRDYVYQNTPWLVDKIPAKLRVEWYPVKNDRDAAARFQTHDSRRSVKTAADDVHGGFRLQKIPTRSRFFQNANNIKASLAYAFERVVRATTPAKDADKIDLKSSTIDDHVTMFRDALIALDELDVNRGKLKAPFITAFLLAYTKLGADVIPFFQRVNAGTYGERKGKLKCPIAAIEDARDSTKLSASGAHWAMVSQVLGALDRFMEGDFRNPEYKPKANKQRLMTVDLDVYLLQKNVRRTGRTLKKRRGDDGAAETGFTR